ncbi:helix-turn-helix transcriptional regulator, partial [Propionicimonas sp.]|uniref:helix-turn-helix transcriptional regulator n=1 Tax=Propionicimonas sp. TaxID=1955623 RepID=UPI0039E4FFEE
RSSTVLATMAAAKGLASLVNGEFADALASLARIWDPGAPTHHTMFALVTTADAIDAALGVGDRALASERAEVAARARDRWMAPVAVSADRYAQCALAGAEDLDRVAEELALAPIPVPFLHARAQLGLGTRFRRLRRIPEARRHLRGALDAFAAMPAPAWEQRSRDELRATGERLPYPPVSGRSILTPQEDRIAGFAASGLTNRQIAQRLFLSPRTVETHLYASFRKLGISERGQLADVLGTVDHPGPVPDYVAPTDAPGRAGE